MKRLIKLCLATAGIMLAVGMVLHITGAAMGGRAESNSRFKSYWETIPYLSGLTGEPQRIDSGELTDITSIKVDIDCGDITVRSGDDFSVSLYWNLRGYSLDYQVEDGALTVSDKSWDGFNGLSKPECGVTITVPNLYGTMVILENLDLSTDLGDVDVDVYSLYGSEVRLSTALGDVECVGLLFGEKLKAESDLGDVNIALPWPRENYRWELEAALGDVSVDGEKQGGIAGASSQGGAGRSKVEARSSLGDVRLSFAE